jgi:hypothetical protein
MEAELESEIVARYAKMVARYAKMAVRDWIHEEMSGKEKIVNGWHWEKKFEINYW